MFSSDLILTLLSNITFESLLTSFFSSKTSGNIDLKSKIKKPVFGDFVTCNEEIKKYLLEVKEHFENYIERDNPVRPLNVLIAAPPGSGKTFLIKELSKEINKSSDVNLKFEEHNVGNFQSTEDLLESYRSIQSLNIEGDLPVVFYDEVDTSVNDKKVYKYFLGPLSNGKFYNKNRINSLGKSIMVFAGSYDFTIEKENNEHSKTEEKPISYKEWSDIQFNSLRNRVNGKEDKLPDFTDRMDIVLFIPPLDVNLKKSHKDCEALNLSIAFVKKHFKNIKKIEYAALMILMTTILVSPSLRQAESIVFLSRNPTSDRFKFELLPKNIQNKYEDQLKSLLGIYLDI